MVVESSRCSSKISQLNFLYRNQTDYLKYIIVNDFASVVLQWMIVIQDKKCAYYIFKYEILVRCITVRKCI